MIADIESEVARTRSESHEMNEEDLERYESEVELQIYKEYRDVLPMFRYVVETERRFYLANHVTLNKHQEDGRCTSRSSSRMLGYGTCTDRPGS